MAGKISAAKNAIELIADFVEPLVAPGPTKYAKALRSNAFAGRTQSEAAMKALEDPAFIALLRGESSAGLMGTKSDFGDVVMPILKELATTLKKSGNARPSSAGTVAAVSKPNVQKLGATPLTGFVNAKGKVDLDGYTLALLREGKFSEAVDHLYSQVLNTASLTPQSFVQDTISRGGDSKFFPLRALRNTTIGDELDVPGRLIGRMSSPASAQSGPALEEAKVIAVIPFIKVGKTGKAVFDYKAAEKALGEGFLKQPGVEGTIRQALYYADNPDYLNSIESGLLAKTWPYDILDADPFNPLAYVADTIDTVARSGGASAILPGGQAEAILGQIPGRYMAMRLGTRPAPTQEIPWWVTRIVGGEKASTTPFTTLPPSALRRIASGTELPNLSTARGGIGFGETTAFKGRSGLVDPEFRSLVNESQANFEAAVRNNPQDYPLYEVLDSGLIVPKRTSAEAIIVPSDRAKYGGPVTTMLRQLGSTVQ